MKQNLEISSHPENLKQVRAFVRQCLSDLTLPIAEAELLVLGVDEACSNIIRHAYKDSDCEAIHLTYELSSNSLCFTLRDYGEQADPSHFHGRPLDRPEPGGLGLHLMHHAFDYIDFKPLHEGTELTLVKHLL